MTFCFFQMQREICAREARGDCPTIKGCRILLIFNRGNNFFFSGTWLICWFRFNTAQICTCPASILVDIQTLPHVRLICSWLTTFFCVVHDFFVFIVTQHRVCACLASKLLDIQTLPRVRLICSWHMTFFLGGTWLICWFVVQHRVCACLASSLLDIQTLPRTTRVFRGAWLHFFVAHHLSLCSALLICSWCMSVDSFHLNAAFCGTSLAFVFRITHLLHVFWFIALKCSFSWHITCFCVPYYSFVRDTCLLDFFHWDTARNVVTSSKAAARFSNVAVYYLLFSWHVTDFSWHMTRLFEEDDSIFGWLIVWFQSNTAPDTFVTHFVIAHDSFVRGRWFDFLVDVLFDFNLNSGRCVHA